MTKQCIQKTSSNIDNKVQFSDFNSTDNVWNLSDYEFDEKQSLRIDHAEFLNTDYSENLNYVISNTWL